MHDDQFRLIFKRGQEKGQRPTFSLTVSAEMSPKFETAAHEYGLWNELIYADPKLEEERARLYDKSMRKQKRRERRMGTFVDLLDGPTAIILAPIYLTWKLFKLMYVLPVKLIWWIVKARRAQASQIMRFSELKTGKTITTHSLPEIVEAEEIIQKSTDDIKTHILVAMNYASEPFDAAQTA